MSRKSWIEKREVDVFDIKADVVKTLIELGISENDIHVSDNTKQCYHLEDLALSLLNQKGTKTSLLWRNTSWNY